MFGYFYEWVKKKYSSFYTWKLWFNSYAIGNSFTNRIYELHITSVAFTLTHIHCNIIILITTCSHNHIVIPQNTNKIDFYILKYVFLTITNFITNRSITFPLFWGLTITRSKRNTSNDSIGHLSVKNFTISVSSNKNPCQKYYILLNQTMSSV